MPVRTRPDSSPVPRPAAVPPAVVAALRGLLAVAAAHHHERASAGAAHDQDRDGHHDHELLLALRGALGSGLAFLGGGLLRLLGHGIMLSRGRLRARYTWISEHHG